MTLPDFINGTFESLGGFAIAFSVRNLYLSKVVRGVSWPHVAFFTAWGLWNLFYYPHLGQWFSFAGGFALVSINAVWLAQIAYYLRKEARARADQIQTA